jgi:nitrite reductase/ring-hydroxylating ferredoxin subunit/DMSO/TMAO reductase YedYZ heme-binding membrane subunit
VSVQYQAVGWNRQKRIYDSVLTGGILTYLAVFVGLGAMLYPTATAETLLIRGFGTLALVLLHVILCIGPLCRLDRRFLPLLYNRRHLGVAMFLVALVHGVFSIIQFHALGDVSPLVSLFVSNTRYGSLAQFPFEALGFAALVILFVMAATSHDFWLHNLSAPAWKRIHMMVYLAYALLVAHVVLGALQADRNVVLAVLLGVGLLLVSSLHLLAGAKERRMDREIARAERDGFVEVCAVDKIPEKRAKVVSLGNERVAVFRYDGKVSAISNVCRHQNGPLGEGRIIDGCVTCPWHGYQYSPDTGASPPPFTDTVPTYQTKLIGDKVLVHPCAHPPGTRLETSLIERVTAGETK